MATKAAVWVNGHAVRAENSGIWLNEVHFGWGTQFQTALGPEDAADHYKNTLWFHIPLSTPVILDEIRPKLVKVFLCYMTKGNAKLKGIRLYDGNKDVWEKLNLSIQGNHPHAVIDANNCWQINPSITIGAGLGISVQVWFGLTKNGVIPEFVFYAAGADFATP